jgi:hypothetical protein
MRPQLLAIVFSAFLCAAAPAFSSGQAARPAISLDEFLKVTEITDARLSPDGTAAVIGTESPDWKANAFRHDLWLWTAAGGLRPLTHLGSEDEPEWSPDGKWIAFISDRALANDAEDGETESDAGKADYGVAMPVSDLAVLQRMIQKPGGSDRQVQIRCEWDAVPYSARRISVGSVRSARRTAGSVAMSAVSSMAHAGSAIISASVALTW